MSTRKKVTNPQTPVRSKTKKVATSVKGAVPPTALWALLPSVSQLRQIVVGAVMDKGAQFRSTGGERAESLNIPPTLLHSLKTLPRPLSLDDVKEGIRATSSAHSSRKV